MGFFWPADARKFNLKQVIKDFFFIDWTGALFFSFGTVVICVLELYDDPPKVANIS
jgi:hypothetical protein